MKNISTTYIASGVAVLTMVLPLFGFSVVNEGTLTQTISEILGALAIVYTFYGRYKAGGVSAFGVKQA